MTMLASTTTVSESDDARAERGAQVRAERAAKDLEARLGHGCSAMAYRYDGEWLVVTGGTGEGQAYAYDLDTAAAAQDYHENADEEIRSDWYSHWCTRSRPVTTRGLALALYHDHEYLLGDGGSPIVTDDERATLDDLAIALRAR